MNPRNSDTIHIALVAGGYSGEREVSLKSQEGIARFLSNSPYTIHRVVLTRDDWMVCDNDGQAFPIDKNDFSYTDKQGSHIRFNYAYITIHGSPGENGLLTGYLDMLQIPYSCCQTLIGAVTFDKFLCNRYLKTFGIRTVEGIRLEAKEVPDAQQILKKVPLPLFVKPCNGGSSLATHKVTDENALLPAINDARSEDSQVLIEKFVEGTEVTCGCYRNAEGIHVLPVTEIVSKNEFFDYGAKYNGEVEEITPARLPSSLSLRIQEITRSAYEILQARGIIRIDYILQEEEPILLEVNTTPGMTSTSFIPQQIAADGKSVADVLESVIKYHLSEQHP